MNQEPGVERSSYWFGTNAVLPVPDVQAAVDYYCTILGFEHASVIGDPPTHGSVSRDHVGIHFTKADATALTVLYLGWTYIFVTDVDILFHNYQTKGIVVNFSPVTQLHGIREFEITDLNGFRLRFGQYVDTYT